ncbi:TIGR04255 family protein [Cobetia crustatorum]|uniref:TIGR04255 family protein n=1 Tax=Cobetia crustatorum TaxID=553385 RepID=A0A558HHW6_9GAMM|nr:TIGR04255 family protein [Cobetia crustatorum]TVU68691.1 TIGR04255 family protein [Cobetia crustatorum]
MDQKVPFQKLKRQPLTLVLAEFRFSRLHSSVSSLNAFQEKMQEHFGGLEEYETRTLHFAADGSQEKFTGWGALFRSSDGGSLVQVDQERLTFITTNYNRFPEFQKECIKALELLEEYLDPKGLSRIGLRYNDAIVPELEEELGSYLDHGLLPPSILVHKFPLMGHRSETQVKTDTGVLVSRALVGSHGFAVMPDLKPPLESLLKFDIPIDRLTAVLDFDHFWRSSSSEGEDFSIDLIREKLNTLHGPTREAFWQVTTDWARKEKWS